MPWDSAEEVAFECEPGTLTQGKLEAIKEIGVTRLSLGVENLNDDILAENGRAHLSKEVYRVMPWIDALDFDQVNIDLIAGMVGETWDSWRDTVQRTIDLNPDSHHCVSDGIAVQHRLLKRYFWRGRSICSGLENQTGMAPLCV